MRGDPIQQGKQAQEMKPVKAHRQQGPAAWRARCGERTSGLARRRHAVGSLVLAGAIGLLSAGARSAEGDTGLAQDAGAPQTLDETRLTMDKWIETQQIISREGKDWQQGKEILLGRLELVKNEIASLQEKISQAQAGVVEAGKKRDELAAENDKLKSANEQLAQAVTGMEAEVRRLFKTLPEPIATRLQPLYQRIPEDPTKTNVSAAERFQNVLGILNEVNKAHSDITVAFEVRNLADGRPAEVQVIYVGLAQAFYVSSGGEAGIGKPTPDGWTWTPSKSIAGDVLMALDILQGKHSPAFVPLPVTIQ